jgi:hypothetical protein
LVGEKHALLLSVKKTLVKFFVGGYKKPAVHFQDGGFVKDEAWRLETAATGLLAGAQGFFFGLGLGDDVV